MTQDNISKQCKGWNEISADYAMQGIADIFYIRICQTACRYIKEQKDARVILINLQKHLGMNVFELLREIPLSEFTVPKAQASDNAEVLAEIESLRESGRMMDEIYMKMGAAMLTLLSNTALSGNDIASLNQSMEPHFPSANWDDCLDIISRW